ncbi:DNA primase [uncultured Muribaculum sp.]|uniref:DNA primase n=1 Tax=uncultured Muribaculum sp. TaxID=1918613 RepID=UPI0025CF1AEC|nr:DNA primase [uncultured Muribaculum sp.]
MKKIDRETVQRILDVADIVDVVSDFVSLKRRGAGYLGLCPFHNERTPSFSVSKSKNICKCFSCGKGGSPVNFIMEHEQMTYQEALRYLAAKYNIEIKEHEMTDEERERETERASLLAVNEFALRHFETNLHDTDDGRNIGMTYLQQRGVSEAMIKRFRLGYALERSTALYDEAMRKGYNEKYLFDTGLCIRTDTGRVYDRFKGRVIFPVFSVSGKVIAFGGRTLKKDLAKYVNSPESAIYTKSNELYGLYQAKQAIVKHNKCILVEGYLDVISMHQSGIENVVASSGTSLTDGQIRLIHRFTDNVTVIYDGDAAGIKASLRGIDMLLREGLNIKVLLLPDGDDPDSFAQSHTSTQVEEYISANEVDFIQFKTGILLQGLENDPIARARAIGDIVQSISVIPDAVTANIYIKECSRRLDIDERVVALEVEKRRKAQAEKDAITARQERARKSLGDVQNATEQLVKGDAKGDDEADVEPFSAVEAVAVASGAETSKEETGYRRFMYRYESTLVKYMLRYGLLTLAEMVDENGNAVTISVADYIRSELERDDMEIADPVLGSIYRAVLSLQSDGWPAAEQDFRERLLQERDASIEAGEAEIRATASDLSDIERREKELRASVDEKYMRDMREYTMIYPERVICSSPDDAVRKMGMELVAERHVLSKVFTKYTHVITDDERLPDIVPRAVLEYKDAMLEWQIQQLNREIKEAFGVNNNEKHCMELMSRLGELHALRRDMATYLGERIILPR